MSVFQLYLIHMLVYPNAETTVRMLFGRKTASKRVVEHILGVKNVAGTKYGERRQKSPNLFHPKFNRYNFSNNVLINLFLLSGK